MRLLAHRPLVHAARLHYAQPHRGYHNAGHLDELVALARAHTPHLDEAEQLALLFHDAVYVPGAPRGDNERLSALLMQATVAALAREEAALAVPAADLDRAARIIAATTHAEPPLAEAARVCDLDLWRLAAPWEAFQQHALGIVFQIERQPAAAALDVQRELACDLHQLAVVDTLRQLVGDDVAAGGVDQEKNG